MCGSDDNGVGIVMGLIAAAAILVFAFAEKHGGAHAPPPQHTISTPATHVAFEMRPVTLDIDLANARVSIDVSL